MIRTSFIGIITLLYVCGIFWATAPVSSLIPEKHSNSPYRRIISLSPSITAMIIDLESENLLAGVTQYHPPLTKPVPIVGSITNPNIEAIIAYTPDIVLASEEDAATQKIELLKNTHIPCFILPVASTFTSLCKNYHIIAKLIHKEELALKKLALYESQRKSLLQSHNSMNAIILLSYNPSIAVSHTSYISSIFADAGIRNMITTTTSRYPLLQQEYLLHPDAHIIIALFKESLPEYIIRIKKIIHISYNDMYLYTPQHYCNSLTQIIIALRNVSMQE